MSENWGNSYANNSNNSNQETKMRKAGVLAFFVHSYAFDAHKSKLYAEYLNDNDWVDIVSEIYNSTQVFFTPHDAQVQYKQLLLDEFHNKEDVLVEWALENAKQFNFEQNVWLIRRQIRNTSEKCKHKRNELGEQVASNLHDWNQINSERLHEKSSAEESSVYVKSERDETKLGSRYTTCLESSTRPSSLSAIRSSVEMPTHVETKSPPSQSPTVLLSKTKKEEEEPELISCTTNSERTPNDYSMNNKQINTQNMEFMPEISYISKQGQNYNSSVEYSNNTNVIKKEIDVERNSNNSGQVCEFDVERERNVYIYSDSASEIDKWIYQLPTEQRYFAQKLRYDTILRGDILIGLLQQCFCVIGADVFFHPVPSNTTMEYNGIRLGSYQTVIYRPMSLMVIKRMIAESKRECYHLLHRSLSSHNNKNKNTSNKEFKYSINDRNNNNIDSVTKLEQDVSEKESASNLPYNRNQYKNEQEWEENNSELCSQDETLSNRSSQNNNNYNNNEMTCYANDMKYSVSYSDIPNTMTPTSMKRSRSESSDNDDISSLDSNSISHYGSRYDDVQDSAGVLLLLHEHSHPLRIATLAELERSLWLIAANCVTFNAPETYYPQTARRFISACTHVLLNFCKRQVVMHFHK